MRWRIELTFQVAMRMGSGAPNNRYGAVFTSDRRDMHAAPLIC